MDIDKNIGVWDHEVKIEGPIFLKEWKHQEVSLNTLLYPSGFCQVYKLHRMKDQEISKKPLKHWA